MADRPTVLEILQIGKESSYGVAVPANKQLFGLQMQFEPKIPTEIDRAQGSKTPVGVVVGKEMTDINFSGNAALNDLIYVFSGLLESPTISTPGGGTLTRRWTFQPSDTDADSFESFTMEKGSSLGASRVPGVRFDEADFTFTPEKSVDVKGKAFGQLLDDEATMTATPTGVAKQTLSPRGCDVYIADSVAGLSAGQIEPLEMRWGIKNRHTPVNKIRSDQPSFSNTVERGYEPTGQIVMPMDATAIAYMASLRAAEQKFIRYLWTGPLIEGSLYYKLQITMPFHFRDPKEQDKSDVHCRVFDLIGTRSVSEGFTIQAIADTTMTAL